MLDLTFQDDFLFRSPTDPKRQEWFKEVDCFERLSLRKLRVMVNRGIVLMSDENIISENNEGLK
jgi:hypothetical protein